MAAKLTPIPQPRTVPILKNVPDLADNGFHDSVTHLAKRYGEIFRLDFPGGWRYIILSSWSLVNEVCDDTRFSKSIDGDLEELRDAVRDGLFTARGEEEENWGVAHRVLMSAFGPMSIRGMFNEMHEVATQLALKWARHGSSEALDIGEDFLRLTLDTVALCSMGFRFNSYYSEKLHPFIEAMYGVLSYVAKKSSRPPLPSIFYRSSDRKNVSNIKLLRSTAREVLNSRKAAPKDDNGRKDLLSAMLTGVDSRTGRSMTDDSIIDNLITFLVAGHETTASTLQFMMYNLVKHPEAYRKAQQEVDDVVGIGAISIEHIPKLKYLNAVFRETLRMSTPISAFVRRAHKDEIIGGKYAVKPGEQLVCFIPVAQRDPVVYGPTADDFVPERMLDDNFDRIQKEFPNSWTPFGTGMRACIGRPFAWQEIMLAYAVLLQNFNFIMEDPTYTLQISETLTIKPKDFKVRAIPRNGISPSQLEARLAGGYVGNPNRQSPNNNPIKTTPKTNGTRNTARKIAIYYGSNSGTCEFMALKLASDAASHGFDASIDRLDAAKESIPKGLPVVIITASYEGQPPDNAGHFVQWIENLGERDLQGVVYAVFGCGHRDWVKTYQRIPKLIDDRLQQLGGERLTPLASTDAKNRDMFSDFEVWEDQSLWPAIKEKFGGNEDEAVAESALQVTFSTPRASSLRQDVKEALVLESRLLSKGESFSETRHLEVQLPSRLTYAAGDYLAVLPHNPREAVGRAMRRFRLAWDAHVSIQAKGPTTLPVDASVPVSDVLNSYVELSETATKRNLLALSQHTDDAQVKAELDELAGSRFEERVREKKLSVLDILELYPMLQVPFQHFLAMLPPMRVRQYSISSSPLAEAGVASLTYEVLDEPSYSGIGRHTGVASSYLATLRAGDKVQIAIRKAVGGFRLPLEVDKAPLICIAAGTGLAPFRAFIQERAIKIGTGQPLSPAILFYGCRDPEVDDLYREEFDEWEKVGAVTVFRAFSRRTELSEGCKYVQDRLWRERETVGRLWSTDARIYVCGSNKIAEAAKEVLVKIIRAESQKQDREMSDEDALEWFVKQRNERFSTDVFD